MSGQGLQTGPPNLGDNRFAPLAISPPSKKRRQPQKLDIAFPELPTTSVDNPRYITIASINTEKTISQFSCFAVHRALKMISKNIVTISNLRDGTLLMLVKSQADADKFINTTELTGICKVQCKLHQALNFVKGTVYAPYLSDIPEKEIVDELKTQKVTKVYKFMKSYDGVSKPSGVILITFELYNLPSKIDISWHSVKVREYIPNPMRCKSCQLLGHTTKKCVNSPL
ncbi:uncharacterized protein LOC123257364 [Drosophila ananassae]|uniref:uncharacterized protein LOC123257364 n=1 Tax=Drosophila ananassae TaxID=7217 RepID=UPI001CFFE187|nr:uncharacterized protein LOC123257364 [Drosophila ananassae]